MTITKEFLALMWRARLFETSDLRLTTGELIHVHSMGLPRNEGVRGAEIQNVSYRKATQEVRHYGSVKFNVKSSDWYDEKTVNQPDFSNVILHVVSECDTVVSRNGVAIDTLIISVDPALEDKRHSLALECTSIFAQIDTAYQENILSRQGADRIKRKSQELIEIYNSVHQNWERTTMIAFIRSLGMGKDKKPYEELALKIPFHILKTMENDTTAVEALIFGQAEFLRNDDTNDPYFLEVMDTYKQIKKTYKLDQRPIEWSTARGIKNSLSRIWKTAEPKARIRPNSMTSPQLVRAAAILSHETSLFNRIVQERDYLKLRELFAAPLSKYWQTHSGFGIPTKSGEKKISELRIDLFMINFVAPMLNAYGMVTKNDEIRDWAIEVLQLTPYENNAYTKMWAKKGFTSTSAFYSQGVIQFETMLCKTSACDNCPIGAHILADFYKKIVAYRTKQEEL